VSLTALALPLLVLLVLGYRFHAARVARAVGIDDRRATPACTQRDDIDFVPTPRFYLFGQHFSAIAAAGPIAGPILACQTWGWLPCLLWIGLGVVLIGAVHDFTVLAASVRHGARSIAGIVRERLGGGAGRAMLGFLWIALIYVIVAFTEITVQSFVVGTEELAGRENAFHPGGAVAFASAAYLGVAVVMGLAQRALALPLWLASLVFVPAAFAVTFLGAEFSTALLLDARTWALILLAYCGVASIVPVWALLQPRGYLGGFVLYAALLAGVIGLLFGGYEIRQPMFTTWNALGDTGALFPFLFVTIACGACSGFHGLVCSGTTSKQIARESHMQPVGYGGMLAEGMVALIAMVTIMIVTREEVAGLAPGTIYGNGIGRFVTLIVGEQHFVLAATFGALAFSTFVFDTLDVCTRLGRYVLQELFGWKGMPGAIAATLLTLAVPAAVLLGAQPGAWRSFWTLFGASNQLLAALSLLTIAVWLRAIGRPTGSTLWPGLFVLAVTATALAGITWNGLQAGGSGLLNGVCALVLLALAAYVVVCAVGAARRPARRAAAE
jgi:carbon starvation protein